MPEKDMRRMRPQSVCRLRCNVSKGCAVHAAAECLPVKAHCKKWMRGACVQSVFTDINLTHRQVFNKIKCS